MIKNHYGITVDSEAPTTGVFQNNHVAWLYDALDCNGLDIDYEAHCKVCRKEYHDNCYETDGTQTQVIGFRRCHSKNSWFNDVNYRPDEKAEFSSITGEVYTQVVRSKWVLRAALCSPCYPGQADADTEGDFLSYSLPPDMFDEDDPIRARIFEYKKGKKNEHESTL